MFDIEARSRGEKEATILHNLQDAKPHPNIVLPYGSFIQSGRYYIALEYANEGSLLDYFYRGPSFPDQRSLENFFEQLFALYSALQKLEDPRYKMLVGSTHTLSGQCSRVLFSFPFDTADNT